MKQNNKNKTNPFKTPDGYFETFTPRLEAKLFNAEEKVREKRSIIRILKPYISLAASFSIVAVLTYFIVVQFSGFDLNSISHNGNVYSDEFLETATYYLDDSEIIDFAISETNLTPTSDFYSDEDVYEYLLQDDSNLDLLMN